MKPFQLIVFSGLTLVGIAGFSPIRAQTALFVREIVESTFQVSPPNAPGMVLTGVIAEYKPGTSTPPHHHGDTFVLAYVLSGSVVSKLDDGQERVFHAGESFTENPNAHHVLFRNPSKAESARVLAIFLAPKSEKDLVILDRR